MIVFMLGGKIETCSMGGTTFRLSQSSYRLEGDQKTSDRDEKFYRYFSCRTSVVQQPSISVQNSNFAYASLLRNLVLHCDFPVVSPPPWKIHNTRYPYRSSCVDEGKGLSRVRQGLSRTSGSSPHVNLPTRYWALLVISDPTKLLLC